MFFLSNPSQGEYKDRGSKFIAYAFPAEGEEEALACLEQVRREHPKARHHCFAWRLGMEGERYRANDDGEPSGTAGRPILGQIDSFGLTNVVIIVARYFGGTLLGTSGLIQAYRESAAEALQQGVIEERKVRLRCRIDFDYSRMSTVMNAIKRLDLPQIGQDFGEKPWLEVGILKEDAEETLHLLRAHLLGRKPEDTEPGAPTPEKLTWKEAYIG